MLWDQNDLLKNAAKWCVDMLELFKNVPKLKKMAPWWAPSKNRCISAGNGFMGRMWAPPIFIRPGIVGLGYEILRCVYTMVTEIFLCKLSNDGSGIKSAKCFSAMAIWRGKWKKGRMIVASNVDRSTLNKRSANVISSLKSSMACGTCDHGVAKPLLQSKNSEKPYVPIGTMEWTQITNVLFFLAVNVRASQLS